MKRHLDARLGKLEEVLRVAGPTDRWRVIIRRTCGPSNLRNSRCTRTLLPNGLLLDVVHLDGGRDGLSNDDLERFIAGFPINRTARTS